MRERGVFLPPSQFEAMFVSLAHTDEDIDQVIAAAEGLARRFVKVVESSPARMTRDMGSKSR